LLVLHVERRHDPFSQHARPKAAGCAARDASIKDQLHLVRTTDVEILAHHFFEETAPRERPIEDLGQRELGLEARELIPIACGTVRGGAGTGGATEPPANGGVDLRGIESGGDLLDTGGIVGRADAIVQRLITDLAPRRPSVAPSRTPPDQRPQSPRRVPSRAHIAYSSGRS